jgi:hypothetical protein
MKKSVGFAFFLLFGVLLVFSRAGIQQEPLVGDEPHYALIAQSIALDGDADIKNNYQDATYKDFYTNDITGLNFPTVSNPQNNFQSNLSGSAERHVDTRYDSSRPHWYSYHTAGLPLLLAPFLAIAGLNGMTVAMLACAAFAILLTYIWTYRVTGRTVPAVLATVTVAASFSFISLSGRLFPDIPIAACLLVAVVLMEQRHRQWYDLALLGAVTGIAYAIHPKTLLMFGTVLAIVAWQTWRSGSKTRVLALLLPAAAALAAFEAHLFGTQGVLLPSDMYGKAMLGQQTPWEGLSAMALNGTKGAMVNNPTWILAIIGLPLWWRFAPRQFGRVMLVLMPSVLLFTIRSPDDNSAGYTRNFAYPASRHGQSN